MGRIARTSGYVVSDCVNCSIRLRSVFASYSADLASLNAISTVHKFEARQTLFAEGDPTQWIFRITSGAVRIFKSTPNGKQQGLGFALPGDILGLAGQGSHKKSAEAVSDVTTNRIGHDGFHRLLADSPALLAHVRAQNERTLDAAHEQMLSLIYRTAQERLAIFLIDLHSRLGCHCDRAAPLQLPMLQRDIADHIGISREATSRAFTNLERRGILTPVSGGVVIRNMATLTALARCE